MLRPSGPYCQQNQRDCIAATAARGESQPQPRRQPQAGQGPSCQSPFLPDRRTPDRQQRPAEQRDTPTRLDDCTRLPAANQAACRHSTVGTRRRYPSSVHPLKRTHRVTRNDHPICALDAQHTGARHVGHLGASQGGAFHSHRRTGPARSLGQPQAAHGGRGAKTTYNTRGEEAGKLQRRRCEVGGPTAEPEG